MTGAVICTTPQDVSLADVSRGIEMFRKLNVPVLGVVENMSGFICPHCNERTDIFGSGGGRDLAARYELPFLGAVPRDPRIRGADGDGRPIMAAAPSSPIGEVFRDVASHIAAQVSQENFSAAAGPVMPSGPRLPVAPSAPLRNMSPPRQRIVAGWGASQATDDDHAAATAIGHLLAEHG